MEGLIYASSTVMLDSARRRIPVAVLVRWLLGLGIEATLAANVRYGLGHGLIGAAVGGWPATALVGSHELLMVVIRGPQAQADVLIPPDCASKDDPLQEQAAQLFADDLAAAHIPRYGSSVRDSTSAGHAHSAFAPTCPRSLGSRPETSR